jgi:hypothetical protein
VVDSVEGEAVLPAYRMASHLEGHIAKAHPGLDLVDWIVDCEIAPLAWRLNQ